MTRVPTSSFVVVSMSQFVRGVGTPSPPAVSTTGEALGVCVAVENYGAGDVLEIERPPEDGKRGKRFMVPMRAEAVPECSDLMGLVIDAAYVE